MAREITVGDPPELEDKLLQFWLHQFVLMTDSAFSLVNDFEPTGLIPEKPTSGMVRYFMDAIAGTDITHEGMWCYVNDTWKEMTQP